MANTMKLEIITPEETVYSEQVEMVILQGAEGQIGILPNHTPLIAQLRPGEMIIQKEGRKTFLAVGEGLAFVSGELMAVATDMAVAAEIDEAKVEEARQRAAARLQDELSGEDVASVNVALIRSLVQLNVKRSRRV